MNRDRTRGFVTSLCVALFFGTVRGAPSEDGKLVDAAVVTLAGDDIKKLEAVQTQIGTYLDQIEIQSITYLSDGLKVKGYLVAPKRGEKLPCVIFNRGGNREFGALTDLSVAAMAGRIASWGYVVVASQYRGNAGGEGEEEFGGRDVHDVLNLLPLLDSVPQADTSRVGMFGWSRGGMMTYLALAKTDKFAAAVVGGGITDLADCARRRPEMETGVYAQLIPNYSEDKTAALAARSAVGWAEALPKRTPILLLHGTADARVHPSESLAIASKLLEFRHPFRLVLLEGGDHGLSEHRAEVERLARHWLDHYVRDRTTWPSLEPHGP